MSVRGSAELALSPLERFPFGVMASVSSASRETIAADDRRS
jgi:hypothetical protein